MITIYHNPKCSTSRTVLGYLNEKGVVPHVIEYLQTPPSRAELKKLIAAMGKTPADVLRWKEPLAADLKLDREKSSADALLDAMAANPVLIERPIVVTDTDVRLCRPADAVKELVA